MQDWPLVLCGPIVRRVATDRACVWVALREGCTVELTVYEAGRATPRLTGRRETVQLGEHLHVVAVSATLDTGDTALEWGERYAYDLSFTTRDATERPRRLHDEGVLCFGVAGASALERLVYDGEELPGFRLAAASVRDLRLVHGSCRKPHGKGQDALADVDDLLAGDTPPQMLVLTGDQIYADDVDPADDHDKAGVVPRGLLDAMIDRCVELFDGEDAEKATELAEHAPRLAPGKRRQLVVEEASFTTITGQCHLVTLAEFYAMYLFQWSDVLWRGSGLEDRESLRELRVALPRVRRVLANVATYMTFDDHDVTDDWNRTQVWVDRVGGSALGHRIIRNALVACALFQHWGNDPETFEGSRPGAGLLAAVDGWDGTAGEQADAVLRHVHVPRSGADLEPVPASALRWHYRVASPGWRLVALDIRSRRRYRSAEADPGLMSKAAIDEALDLSAPPVPATIVVSPTPVLGIGLIELIQKKFARLFDLFRDRDELLTGRDLIDAETWSFDLEIYDYLLERLASLRRVLVLSGDIHYAFGASLVAEGRDARIVNFVASPLLNEMFPTTFSRFLNLFRDDRLEAVDGEELVSSEIPESVLSTRRSTSTLAFREDLLQEESADVRALPGSRRRAEVFAGTNLGEIRFPDGKTEQLLLRRGHGRAETTLYQATFPVD